VAGIFGCPMGLFSLSYILNNASWSKLPAVKREARRLALNQKHENSSYTKHPTKVSLSQESRPGRSKT